MQASVKEDRDKFIGGSDVSIIMGLSPFKTRWELLQEKAGLIKNNFEGNEYTEYGNIMEPKIRDYLNELYKYDFKEGKHINGDIRCHTDGENSDTILEIKTTSRIFNEYDMLLTLNDYKDYLVQLLFYMINTNKPYGKLAIYRRPADFDTFFRSGELFVFNVTKEEYKELVAKINNAVDQFRIDLQKLRENPFLTEEDLLPIDLTEEAEQIVALEEELRQDKIKKKKLEELKENLKRGMEKYGIKRWETPNGVKMTLVEDKPDETVIEKVLNEEQFKKENIGLVQQYELKQAEYLEEKEVIKKGRKGYVKITLPKEG